MIIQLIKPFKNEEFKKYQVFVWMSVDLHDSFVIIETWESI